MLDTINFSKDLSFKVSSNPNVSDTFNRLKGARAERKLLDAWQPRWRHRQPHAQWIIKLTQSAGSSLEDQLGIDIIFDTKFDFNFAAHIPKRHPFRNDYKRLLPLGAIPVQVKSSYDHARAFENYDKNLPIPVIVLGEFDEGRKLIQKKTLATILHKFPFLVQQMNRMGCTVSMRMQKMLSQISPNEVVIFV